MNPNKPLCISQHEMEHFIGTLIMTGIYSFPTPRFFWINTTRVESIASVMSRDKFLQIRKNLHIVDNSNQLFAGDPAFDRAYKVRPLLNIVKENFRKIPKEEKLSADEQIIPFKGKRIHCVCNRERFVVRSCQILKRIFNLRYIFSMPPRIITQSNNIEIYFRFK